MKKRIFGTFLIILSFLLCMGCSKNNPTAPKTVPDKGKLVIALDAAANIVSGKVIITKGEITQSLPITISGHSGTVTFGNLQVGRWNIQVQLFDIDGVEIYSGTGEAAVKKDQSVNVTVRVNHNTGDLQIIIEIPQIVFRMVYSYDSGIYLINSDSTGRQKIASGSSTGYTSGNAVWGANTYRGGTEFVLLNESWAWSSSPGPHTKDYIRLMNLDGSNIRDIFEEAGDYFQDAHWSWRGDKIAFGHQTPAGGMSGQSWPESDSVYVISPYGAQLMDSQANNTNGYDGYDSTPVWTPDDCIIYAYREQLSGPKKLMVMNSDGTGRRILLDSSWDATPTDCSPDFTVLFHSAQAGNFNIYSIQMNGSGLTQLTHGPGSCTAGHFNDDGEKIAFQSDQSGSPGVYIMDKSGNNQVYVTDGTNPFFVY